VVIEIGRKPVNGEKKKNIAENKTARNGRMPGKKSRILEITKTKKEQQDSVG